MGQVADAANKFMDSRLPKAMAHLGEVTTGIIKDEIDTVCPAYHGVAGGAHSPPGSPPYLETGRLHAGVGHKESDAPDGHASTINSNREPESENKSELVSIFLEFGTHRMAARPYMRPVMNRAQTIVPDAMREGFSA